MTQNPRKKGEAAPKSSPSESRNESPEEIQALIHELEVHQIELEMQNEELRRSQSELEAASQKYVDFYDFAPVGFLTLERNGLIKEINLTAAGLLGKTREKLVNTLLRFYIVPQDLDLFRRYLRRVFQAPEEQHCEARLKRQTGEFYARLDGIIGNDSAGGKVCRISITDISDLKQAEQKLRESETLFASFLGHLPSVAVIRDLEGRYLFANQAWEEAFGKVRSEWLGKTTEDLWPQKVAEKFKEQDKLVIRTREPLRTLGTLRHPDGLHHWISYRFPILDPEGSPILIGLNAMDITEHIETKKRLEHLLGSSPAAIYSLDLKDKPSVSYMSENIEALLGWEAPNFLEDPSFWFDHVHPEDLPGLPNLLELPATSAHLTKEYRFLARDGTYHWMHDEINLRRDDAGNAVEASGAWMDITSRKQMEQELEATNNRLRTLIQSSPLPIAAVDRDGRITMWNPAAQRTFGWEEQEVLGQPNPIIPPGYEGEFRQLMTRELAGESLTGLELRRQRKDGSFLDVRLFSAPLYNAQGEIIEVMGVMEDITARKEAEATLMRERQRFFSLLDMLPAFVALVAPDHTLPFVNRQFREIFGDPGDRTCHGLISGTQEPCEGCQTLSVFDTHQPVEWEWTHPQGRIFQIYDYPFADIDGSPMILELGIDISERKALETQLMQAQKMEAVGRLAGGVAHDFNNLLMAIMGYGELIRTGLAKNDPHYGYLEDILKAAERAASLTQQLLAFSRRQMMQPQVLNLNRVVADLEKMLRRLIEEHIDLQIIADPELGVVKADPGQIGQIILNLAVNARDAMPRGGQLILKTGNVEFAAPHNCHFEKTPPGGYVMLEVSDSGEGLDEETLSHIFEPFFTTKEPGRGTGLGLPMVYGVVKQNGGYVDVDSLPGQGTTFRIYLPRLEAPVEEPREKTPLAEKLEGSETVLVVEDEAALRTLLCRVLRMFGYEVLEARHGGEALLICERHRGPIHILVTDIVMPQMNGRDLVDRLTPLHPEMKVFYMTGYADQDLAPYGVLDQPKMIIPKPFRPLDLVKKIREFMDASREAAPRPGG
ncbi:MAG: PAS domain S-box protein [Syntrophobacterales bacterium]|nr:PAS domain S-box protein [Syntrophobacterales bacterium]